MKALLISGLIAAAAPLAADPVLEAMQDYTDFATYDAGIVLPAQLTEEIFNAVSFIDTRSAEAFEAGTIPGATHIEWREIFGRVDELPSSGKIVLFCNTGALSAQAAFGLRVLGYENVVVLQTGFTGWQTDAAYKP